LALAFPPFINSLDNPRLAGLRGPDVLRLVAIGFCVGTAFGTFMFGFFGGRSRRNSRSRRLFGKPCRHAYSATLAAHGGPMPYTWTIVGGSLPDGLALDAYTGVIAGTPSSAGVASFSAQVTDNGNPALSATQGLRISILQ
jgi:hypothetical protein